MDNKLQKKIQSVGRDIIFQGLPKYFQGYVRNQQRYFMFSKHWSSLCENSGLGKEWTSLVDE